MSTTPRCSPRRPLPAILLVAAALTAACSSEAPPVADHATHRQLAQGELVGFQDGDAHAWLGIPFVAPPVGRLRWKPPQPPAPWSGVREALAHGNECPQLGFTGAFVGDEDCLTLNVYAPPMALDAIATGVDRRPVMVFIHGGGNSIGSAEVYSGARLAGENDVVVVTVHYRLGVLGWFSHPALARDAATPEEASGNWATLDLIHALGWVQENIAAFGGDPDRVTIFGESAGGIDVYSLLLSPLASGLFHGAISESGFATTFTRAQAEHRADDEEPGEANSSAEVLLKLLVADHTAVDREAAKISADAMSPVAIEAYLRSKSAPEILEAVAGDGGTAGGMYVAPFVLRDGHVIPDADPFELFASGAYNQVPVIVGTNRDEHKLFFAFLSPHVRRVLGMPVGFRDAERYDVLAEYGAKLWKAAGADEPASLMRDVQGPSVFAYRFDWDEFDTPLFIDLPRLIGAGHAVELLFVFGGTGADTASTVLADPESAERLSAAMRSYWAQFAATGNPGKGQGDVLPAWTAWMPGAGEPKFLVLDTEGGGGVRMSSDDLTRAGLIAGVADDPRLADTASRCEVYQTFVQWSDVLRPEEYETVEDGVCRAHPLPARTMFD
jgi:para-nitrobenzyl esterase